MKGGDLMNRITLEDIRGILFSNLNLSGQTLHVSQIQSLVSTNYSLSPEDLLPYVTTRKTNYPYWKHQVQKVLYYSSQNGKIIHNPSSETYTF